MDWHTLSALAVLMTSGFCLGSIAVWSIRLGITPTSTSPKVRKTLLLTLPEHADAPILEAGCGFGGLISLLKKRYPTSKVIGLEQSLMPYCFCRLRFMFEDNVQIKRVDLLTYDFSHATMVVCYLYPGAMTRLAEKFEAELAENSIVISHTFRLPNRHPDDCLTSTDLYKTPVYVYRHLSGQKRAERVHKRTASA